MRVRSGRFMQSFIRTLTLTGYAQNAHKTGILGLRRTRLTVKSRLVINPLYKQIGFVSVSFLERLDG